MYEQMHIVERQKATDLNGSSTKRNTDLTNQSKQSMLGTPPAEEAVPQTIQLILRKIIEIWVTDVPSDEQRVCRRLVRPFPTHICYANAAYSYVATYF